MRIAHIVCVYPPYKGGMGISAYEMAKRLVLRGHEVDVLTSSRVGDIIDEYEEGVRVVRMKPLVSFGNAAILPIKDGKSGKYAELGLYDVIHLHYPFFGTAEIIWLLKKLNPKLRLVIHFHMEADLGNALLKIAALPDALIRNSLFKIADAVICSSFDYIKSSFPGGIKEIWKEDNVRELPFGVDVNRFPNKSSDSLSTGVTDRAKEILFVGGLDRAHYFKGVDVLIEALSLLKKKDWRLTVVGKGELEAEYHRLALSLGIGDRVRFLNNVSYDELPSIYSQSDFLVLPSINKGEAFGLVLLEAMAAGLPVIASRLPGVRMVFNDGVQGLYVEPGDIEDLRGKLEYLMMNKEQLLKMSVAGRALVESKYNWEVVLDRLEEIYNKVVDCKDIV